MKKEEFEPVYIEYHQMVIHLAYDVLHDYDLAQDVCQEVFMKMDEKGFWGNAYGSVRSWRKVQWRS